MREEADIAEENAGVFSIPALFEKMRPALLLTIGRIHITSTYHQRNHRNQFHPMGYATRLLLALLGSWTTVVHPTRKSGGRSSGNMRQWTAVFTRERSPLCPPR